MRCRKLKKLKKGGNTYFDIEDVYKITGG